VRGCGKAEVMGWITLFGGINMFVSICILALLAFGPKKTKRRKEYEKGKQETDG